MLSIVHNKLFYKYSEIVSYIGTFRSLTCGIISLIISIVLMRADYSQITICKYMTLTSYIGYISHYITILITTPLRSNVT